MAVPGNKMGMKGGLILIKGNVGERAGDHMRRGTILIEGNAGDYCGSRMTAGTIAVMGQTGRYAGYAMRRGTLLLWNQSRSFRPVSTVAVRIRWDFCRCCLLRSRASIRVLPMRRLGLTAYGAMRRIWRKWGGARFWSNCSFVGWTRFLCPTF